MSHRKFERPRHGSLGFLPRKRCKRHQGKIRSYPKDDPSKAPHFTGFMSFKAGMTHVVRYIERPGSRMNRKDVVEPVTILEAPPMMVVGIAGYQNTVTGLKTKTTLWAGFLSDECRRRFYKRWYHSKKKAFSKYVDKYTKSDEMQKERLAELKKCDVIRAIVHSQDHLLPLQRRKAHIMEIQINGGSISEKVDFVFDLFEKSVSASSVFSEGEMLDTIGITKGRGFQGVISRWGVTRLPRKTHRGLRKVACIGAWHPSRVQFQVPRAGQQGYHHRTEINKQIYRIASGSDPRSGATDFDITEKSINPIGGFPNYGIVKNDFLLIKGCVLGPKKRAITLRKSLLTPITASQMDIQIKFIDTASKTGGGRFQTKEEKDRYFGIETTPPVAA